MTDKNTTRENEYVEIVEYYDNLLTSGYYDFESLAKNLSNLLGARRKVLDIGIGSGLLSEQMLTLADYEIVGVDFSSKMLEIAQKRLANTNVKLICEDITKFETDVKFEAAISTGGAISATKEDDEIRLYSHITEAGQNEQLLAKLNSQLSENGLLALAIQGPHSNYRKKI